MSPPAARVVLVCFLLAAGLRAAPMRAAGEAEIPGSPQIGQGHAIEDHVPAEDGYGQTPDVLIPYRKSAEPYRRFFLTAPLFRGPGREKPAPAGLRTVRIGLLAPLEGTGTDQAGHGLKRGVELALEEANALGGYQGLPFELVPKNDAAVWGSSANTLVELAYADKVWAVIGSIDSNSTHVALRVALKAEVAIVNVGSGDPTVTETGIPWIVRCTPDDRQTSYRLAHLLFEEYGLVRVAVLRSNNRYGRFGIREFRDAARRMQRPLPMEIQFLPGQEDFTPQLGRLAAAKPEAVVVWAGARDTARAVRQMRSQGMSQPVFGTDRLVSQQFLDLAGEAAEGVVATSWMNPTRNDAEWLAFRQRFRARFGVDPDVFSAYGYDAANLVVGAVGRAGLNRIRIRDALARIRSHNGIAAAIKLDATSNNVAQPLLAQVREGRFVLR